jgi:hypothetical protein
MNQEITLFNAQDASSNADTINLNGLAFRTGNFHVKWSGLDAVDGAVTLQVSNFGTAGTWEDIVGKTLSTASGTWMHELISGSLTGKFYRLSYNAGSNTAGTIDSNAIMKN